MIKLRTEPFNRQSIGKVPHLSVIDLSPPGKVSVALPCSHLHSLEIQLSCSDLTDCNSNRKPSDNLGLG